MKKRLKNLLIITVLSSLPFLTACEITSEDIFYGIFHESENDKAAESKKSLQKSLYKKTTREVVNSKVRVMEKRFSYKMKPYKKAVNAIWKTDGFYRKTSGKKKPVSSKEELIDFYLFMEYHKDTQLRNLQFPKEIREGLLVSEAMFARKAITYIMKKDLGEYNVLKQDLIIHYKNLYQEELVNILYEDSKQLDVLERLPDLIKRYNFELENDGFMHKIKTYLGVPNSVISRGIGTDMVTIYDGFDSTVSEGDIHKLAILLTMEMRLTGANTRIEKFFSMTNSLDGLDKHLNNLEKDLKLMNLNDNLTWVKPRMRRSINYLERLNGFYQGKNSLELSDVFITLQTREDFYALGMLSDALKEVMDSQDYWNAVSEIQRTLDKQSSVTSTKPLSRYIGEDASLGD